MGPNFRKNMCSSQRRETKKTNPVVRHRLLEAELRLSITVSQPFVICITQQMAEKLLSPAVVMPNLHQRWATQISDIQCLQTDIWIEHSLFPVRDN